MHDFLPQADGALLVYARNSLQGLPETYGGRLHETHGNG